MPITRSRINPLLEWGVGDAQHHVKVFDNTPTVACRGLTHSRTRRDNYPSSRALGLLGRVS